jgi:hypothetical protein
MSHELLHTFGYPDLYRYAYNGTPVGSWDIMAGNTNPPQQANMYCKWKYGNWIDEIPEITEAGFYTLYPNQNNRERSVFKIASPNPDEFFVLEFRRKLLPFDSGIPNSGVLIYRINSLFDGNAGTNFTDVFDEVYLYRYGGTMNDEGAITAAAFYLNNPLLNTFNPWTNPNPFLTDGTVCFFELNQFTNKNADSITFYYNPQPISIHENSILTQDVRIYPNPAQNQISVEFSQPFEVSKSYNIYDATGREILNGIFNESKQNIDISSLGTGFYWIKIQASGENKTYKFLKN